MVCDRMTAASNLESIYKHKELMFTCDKLKAFIMSLIFLFFKVKFIYNYPF